MKKAPVRAVMFDLDGTLLNTLDDIADSVNEMLLHYGLPVYPVDDYRYFVGNGVEQLIRRVMPENTPQERILEGMKLYNANYRRLYLHKTVPYPGIPEAVRELKRHGLLTFVLSNKPDCDTRTLIAHHFGKADFDLVCGHIGGVPHKPDPTGAQRILDRFGLAPEETVFTGDSCVDIQTARNAGMPVIGVSWGFRGPLEMQNSDALACSAEELLSLILKMAQG